MKILDSGQGVALRALLRALLVLLTAFGLQLTAEQVGAIQLAAEAVLGVLVRVTPDAD